MVDKTKEVPYFEAKKHLLEVYEAIEPALSRNEYRPLNQRAWAQRLGLLQQRLSFALGVMVKDGVLERRGDDDGRVNLYRLNPKHLVTKKKSRR